MLERTFAIAMNTYREAVRARILIGLLAAALATAAYSLVIASMSLRQEMRIVADLGASSISLFAVIVTIVLGATSLHRELELKTIFPILTRRLRRHEYIVGKYFGIFATLLAFVALDGAFVLGILGFQSDQHVGLTVGVGVALLVGLGVGLLVLPRLRVQIVLPWAIVSFVVMAFLADGAGPERSVLVYSCLLTMAEVSVLAAISMLFSSFSSPFLTAVFTAWLFLIGRSADTLSNLPPKVFGEGLRALGSGIARVVPNLQTFVPPRPLLLGEVSGVPVLAYVGRSWTNSLLYTLVGLALAAAIFRKRDFQ